jgi:hypothetical protein
MIGNIIKCNLEDSSTIMGVRHNIRYSVKYLPVLFWFDDSSACMTDIGTMDLYRECNVWFGIRQDGTELYCPSFKWTDMSEFTGYEEYWI